MLVAGERMLGADGSLAPGWVRLDVERGVIAEVGSGLPPGVADGSVALLLPGFVDMHCHGGDGASFATQDVEEARTALSFHRRHGSTSVVASLVTAATEDLQRQIATLVPLARSGEIAGIHLEGPWLSPHHRGAHAGDLLRLPTAEEIERLLAVAAGQLRMVTLAPELPGALEAISLLRRANVTVAIGHTDCDGAGLARAVRAGASVVTHLCNGMRTIHHRDPGPVVEALGQEALTVELIVDGVHVHPDLVAMVYRASRARIALVSDAMAAAGRGDGRYQLGSLGVLVRDGVATLEDGSSIAGSTLTLERALRAACAAGMPLESAALSATAIPAQALGLATGTISVGAPADLVALDEAHVPVGVWKSGIRCH